MKRTTKLLAHMRSSVSMYIGSHNLKLLAAFLGGFEHALEMIGEPEREFLEAMQRHVESRFPVNISRSWEDIVIFYRANESEAVAQFWKVVDEIIDESNTSTNSQ